LDRCLIAFWTSSALGRSARRLTWAPGVTVEEVADLAASAAQAVPQPVLRSYRMRVRAGTR